MMTKMSSHETWFATTIAWSRAGTLSAGCATCTPQMSSSCVDQRRIRRLRPSRSSQGKSTALLAMPQLRWMAMRARR
ncbi:hypothetical protein D3C72_2350020 [compost metagenome]